jgi:hypothetical protein
VLGFPQSQVLEKNGFVLRPTHTACDTFKIEPARTFITQFILHTFGMTLKFLLGAQDLVQLPEAGFE